MSDIVKETCWSPGRECGECGGWVSPNNSTPCKGTICGPNGIYAQEESNEPSS